MTVSDLQRGDDGRWRIVQRKATDEEVMLSVSAHRYVAEFMARYDCDKNQAMRYILGYDPLPDSIGGAWDRLTRAWTALLLAVWEAVPRWR